MSVGRMRAVTRLEGLTATQKSVLFVLADFENEETGVCSATMGAIAHFVGCTSRTAFSAIKALETKGLLTRKSRQKSESGIANAYEFLFEKFDAVW